MAILPSSDICLSLLVAIMKLLPCKIFYDYGNVLDRNTNTGMEIVIYSELNVETVNNCTQILHTIANFSKLSADIYLR